MRGNGLIPRLVDELLCVRFCKGDCQLILLLQVAVKILRGVYRRDSVDWTIISRVGSFALLQSICQLKPRARNSVLTVNHGSGTHLVMLTFFLSWVYRTTSEPRVLLQDSSPPCVGMEISLVISAKITMLTG